ncbi:type 1 glutamine amidotransferase [Acinetobacter boissieri]|uniref:GMP synthase-Glutamine amidotransferase n=1 Tax=Acinetobacter boissieri TaxID=1219383 RepID=A0A1G6HVA1_9GAMM|nr:type 1 glutamine amidotransferase [Acinetobacter boissieri]SDB98120.1 GMP synthase-Glutamine amidotransferase [Acinetobacter boissieri]
MKQNLRVHCFQHTACDNLNSCRELLLTHHAQVSTTEFFALPTEIALDIEALPNIQDVDLLIVMGGKIHAEDEANYPWLKIEKRWIRRYIALKKPVLGLCVGGQIIASALGAPVLKNERYTMSWNRVQSVANLPNDCFKMPQEMHVMSLSQDISALPKGAISLATNENFQNSCYQIGRNILGFQFSLEITQDGLTEFLDEAENIFDTEQSFIQLKNAPKDYFLNSHRVLEQAIEYVLQP